jgi:hypothetical protein
LVVPPLNEHQSLEIILSHDSPKFPILVEKTFYFALGEKILIMVDIRANLKQLHQEANLLLEEWSERR